MKSIHVWGVVSLAVLLAGPPVAAQQPVPSADGTEPAAAVRPAAEPAAPVRLIKFSGALKDALGQPHAGTLGVTFALYAEQEGGAPLWLEAHNVALDPEGRYTVLLGAAHRDGLPLKLFASSEARWLGIQVEGEPEQPRILLVSVPYALKAEEAERLGGKPASEFVLAEDLKTPEGQEKLGLTGGGGPSAAAVQKATRFKATTATGPAYIWDGTSGPPLRVGSTALVANLNADRLDSLDSADLQQRVAGTCPAGESIRIIATDGTVTCEPDDVGVSSGGTVTQIDTGTGLTGGPITLAGTLSIDTAVVPQLATANTFNGTQTAPNFVATNSVSANSATLGGDASLTSSPRTFVSAFFPGNLVGPVWKAARLVPDKAITVTRVTAALKRAGETCSTSARLRLTDGTTGQDIVVLEGSTMFDSGPITLSFAAGAPLEVALQQGADCGAQPADANVVIQYRMQSLDDVSACASGSGFCNNICTELQTDPSNCGACGTTVGGDCNTGQPGICAGGRFACQGGSPVCQRNEEPFAEVCDGSDSDCDATVDNGVCICGNGVVETFSGEACDDGNTVAGDGCSASCTVEVPVCGNGIVEAGEACDDGNTVAGDGCSASCMVEQALGAACTSSTQCASGFCTDGFCCDTICGGACQACVASKTGGSNGTCGFITAGTDPDIECVDQGAASCGTNGFCNGAGACQLYSPDTVCNDGQFCTGTDTCNGTGTCVGAGLPCNDGVACTTDSCDEALDSCSHTADDAACDDGNVCTADSCDVLTGCTFTNEPDGTPCGSGLACQNGQCVDTTSPAAPTLTGTNPASPSNNNNPSILGTAEPSSVVRLFTNSDCTGTAAGSGVADGSGSFSIAVLVSDNSTTTFFANAGDAAGNVSGCSTSSVTYVEVSLP